MEFQTLERIFQSVGKSRIDELHVLNGINSRINSLPFVGLRSITIVNSTVESISQQVPFRNF